MWYMHYHNAQGCTTINVRIYHHSCFSFLKIFVVLKDLSHSLSDQYIYKVAESMYFFSLRDMMIYEFYCDLAVFISVYC